MNWQLISRSLTVDDMLLFDLTSVDIINDDIPFLKQLKSRDQRNALLMQSLSEISDSQAKTTFDAFLQALRHNGQEHVANIFNPESDVRPMSDEHYQLLTSRNREICKFMDPLNGVLDELVSCGAFSDRDRNQVRVQRGLDAMARETIDILSRKADSAFDLFISALHNTGQEHVANMLTGEGEAPLSEIRRTLLKMQRSHLLNAIDIENSLLIDKLRENEVLNSLDAQRIAAERSRNRKTCVLLDILERKSQSAYDRFLEALRDVDIDQATIALALEGMELRQTVDPDFLRRSTSAAKQLKVAKLERDRNGTILSGREHEVNEIADVMRKNGFIITYNETVAGHIMTETHQHALQEARRWLVHDINLSEELFDKLALKDMHKKVIRQAGGRVEQVKTLIDIVACRPDSAFSQLVDALNQTGQMDVALRLTEYCKNEMIGLPVELLELVLMRTFIKLFTEHLKSHNKTHEAIAAAYSALSAVCYYWWQTMNGWPQSNTRHWLRHRLHSWVDGLCRPFAVRPRLQYSNCLAEPAVWSVTDCDNRLFVVCRKSDTIQVFGPDYKQLSSIGLAGLNEPRDIVACRETNRLYIADWPSCVWRVSLDGDHVDQWLTSPSPTISYTLNAHSLSLTSRRLLVTSRNNELYLFGPDAVELKRVSSPGMRDLRHAVETSHDTFIVSHYSSQSEVSEIDACGNVIRSFVDRKQLGNAWYLALDSDGRVLIADCDKHRVLLLNSRLELERILLDSEQNSLLKEPWRLCYVEQAHLLLVTSLTSKHVQAYNFCS